MRILANFGSNVVFTRLYPDMFYGFYICPMPKKGTHIYYNEWLKVKINCKKHIENFMYRFITMTFECLFLTTRDNHDKGSSNLYFLYFDDKNQKKNLVQSSWITAFLKFSLPVWTFLKCEWPNFSCMSKKSVIVKIDVKQTFLFH